MYQYIVQGWIRWNCLPVRRYCSSSLTIVNGLFLKLFVIFLPPTVLADQAHYYGMDFVFFGVATHKPAIRDLVNRSFSKIVAFLKRFFGVVRGTCAFER